MAAVPVYDGPKETLAPIGAQRQPQASAELFADQTAREIGKLGQAIQRTGDVAGRIAIDMQERENTDKVLRAKAQLDENELLYTSELENRRGVDAKGATQDTLKWWDESAPEYMEGFDNDAQREAFGRIMQQRRTAHMRSVSRYESSEMRRSLDEAANASVAGAINSAAAAAFDEKKRALHAQELKNTIRAQAQTQGWPKEVKDAKMSEALTKMHKRVIEQMQVTNPAMAKKYYEANKSEVAGGDRAVIEKALETSNLRAKSQAKTDRLMSSGKSYEDQLKEARTIADSKIRDEVVSRLKVRESEARDILKRTQDEAYEEGKTLVVDGGRSDDIPIEVWNRMGADQKDNIKRYEKARAGEAPKKDDYDMLDYIERSIEQGTITAPEQIREFEPFLRHETIRRLRTSIDKRDEVPQGSIRTAFQDRVGKTLGKWNSSDTNREHWQAFKEYINTNVKESRRPEDVDVWADRWFMEGHTLKNEWGDDPDTLGEAITAGRTDFVLDTPDNLKGNVRGAVQLWKQAGYEVGDMDTATDEFYTKYYLESQRHFKAQGIDTTPALSVVYAILRQGKKPVTPANVSHVLQQLQAKIDAEARVGKGKVIR